MRSLLGVVSAADNFPAFPGLYPSRHPTNGEVYIPFHLTLDDHKNGASPVGLIRPEVLKAIQEEDEGTGLRVERSDDGTDCVILSQEVLKAGRATDVINALAKKWRDQGRFPGPLGGE